MGSQVKLQWNQTSTGANVTQSLEKKVGSDAWAVLKANSALTADAGDATKFTVIDTDVTYSSDTDVKYRVTTSNGVYSVAGNEITVSVPATIDGVSNLTGDVEPSA